MIIFPEATMKLYSHTFSSKNEDKPQIELENYRGNDED